jgi:hypothetical protein
MSNKYHVHPMERHFRSLEAGRNEATERPAVADAKNAALRNPKLKRCIEYYGRRGYPNGSATAAIADDELAALERRISELETALAPFAYAHTSGRFGKALSLRNYHNAHLVLVGDKPNGD